MKKSIIIPIKQVDTGVIHCLYSSNTLNFIAKLLHERNPREYSDEIPIVLYYYALEEFGKALYLIRLKSESVDDSVKADLYDHNIKIKEALKHNPDLFIRKLEIKREWIDPNADMFKSRTSYELSDEAIINGFFERSSLWLTDYDEEMKDWKPRFDIHDTDEISRKIELLQNEVAKLQRDYR